MAWKFTWPAGIESTLTWSLAWWDGAAEYPLQWQSSLWNTADLLWKSTAKPPDWYINTPGQLRWTVPPNRMGLPVRIIKHIPQGIRVQPLSTEKLLRDQRHAPRIDYHTPLQLIINHRVYNVSTEDVSSQGCRIAFPLSLLPYQVVQIHWVAHQYIWQWDATVAWIKPISSGYSVGLSWPAFSLDLYNVWHYTCHIPV